MRFRLIKEEPPFLAYRDEQIYFRTMYSDGYWCWFAIKGRPPRSEKQAPSGQRLVITCHAELTKLWRLKKEGFKPTTAAATRIMQRLVRDGYAEEC